MTVPDSSLSSSSDANGAVESRIVRTELGIAGVALAMLGIVWTVVADGPVGVIPIVLFGLGIGSAANRLVFGVFRPVPAVSRRRERSG